MTDTITEARRFIELAEKATPGDIDSAERIDDDCYECPACGGEGTVDARTYTNYDGKAVGVQFFGVGPEFVRNEEWYRAKDDVSRCLAALVAENEALRKDAERWRYVRQFDCIEITHGEVIDLHNAYGNQQTTEQNDDAIDAALAAEAAQQMPESIDDDGSIAVSSEQQQPTREELVEALRDVFHATDPKGDGKPYPTASKWTRKQRDEYLHNTAAALLARMEVQS